MINLREWALPLYTILMEIAGGTLFLLWVARAILAQKLGRQVLDRAIQNILWILLLTTATSLIGSHFHLSKPHYSFLVLVNVSHSWLSREIAYNLLFLVFLYSLIWIEVNEPERWHQKNILGWMAILSSCGNIYAMAKIYILPTQPIWDSSITIITFFASSLLLGSVVLISLLILDLKYSEIKNLALAQTQSAFARKIIPWLALTSVFFMFVLLFLQTKYYTAISQSSDITIQASVILLSQFYSALSFLRNSLAFIGISFLIISIIYYYHNKFPLSWMLVPSYISCLLIMISEILSRFLFYALHIRIGI